MADMIIVEPYALALSASYALPQAIAPCIYVEGGSSKANLLTDDPRELYIGPAGAASAVYIDLGADREWDTIALINTNGIALSAWGVATGTQAEANYGSTVVITYGDGVFRLPSEDQADLNGPAFYHSQSVRVSRYIYIAFGHGSGALQIGRLVVGKSWKPSLPREPGGGRPPIDTGSRERLPDGGLARVPGSLVSGYQWVFGDLDDADLAKLWGIMRRRRTTEPILLVEDPGAPVAEGVHYGTFTALERYERSIVSKSRWALTMEDWL